MKVCTKISMIIIEDMDVSYENLFYTGTRDQFEKEMQGEGGPFITLHGSIYDGNLRTELHFRKDKVLAYAFEEKIISGADIFASNFKPIQIDLDPPKEETVYDLSKLKDGRPEHDPDKDPDEEDLINYIRSQLNEAIKTNAPDREDATDLIYRASLKLVTNVKDFMRDKPVTFYDIYQDYEPFACIDMLIDCFLLYVQVGGGDIASAVEFLKSEDSALDKQGFSVFKHEYESYMKDIQKE